jgi:phage anti-repressor protein
MSNIPQKTLIPIYQGKIDSINQHLVDARILHTYLEVGKHFTDWIKQRIKEYGFSSYIDYKLTDHKVGKRSNVIKKKYELTLDMAKELAMVERNKKGREARRYFIECERQLIESFRPTYKEKNVLKQESIKINDLFKIGTPLTKTLVEVTHTEQGEIINISQTGQDFESEILWQTPTVNNQDPTIVAEPSWLLLVEVFFDEIERGGIPEKMRQNMLLSKEMTSMNEQHGCLFFRLSNLIAFFRKTPRFSALMQKSTIQTASMLLEQLKTANVLAFGGKTKEKGIPMNTNALSDNNVRRVSHLVAIDLVVLERNYGIGMSSSEQIAKNYY